MDEPTHLEQITVTQLPVRSGPTEQCADSSRGRSDGDCDGDALPPTEIVDPAAGLLRWSAAEISAEGLRHPQLERPLLTCRNRLRALGVESHGHFRGATLIGDTAHDDVPLELADPDLECVADANILGWLHSRIVQVHAASDDGVRGCAAGLVEAGRPEPLVNPGRLH